ncbi:uncharacterized protein LOC131995925 [Stomoxys calcitrans]|uniref:uncharacterized protein LOC131995925 n=1 Tax=Stomoxys calcitrans TaxID=35570 RepID=UPI0027E36911|nr:uncharacterized protein LOC131995925 [Stomoxys calcitrans]
MAPQDFAHPNHGTPRPVILRVPRNPSPVYLCRCSVTYPIFRCFSLPSSFRNHQEEWVGRLVSSRWMTKNRQNGTAALMLASAANKVSSSSRRSVRLIFVQGSNVSKAVWFASLEKLKRVP